MQRVLLIRHGECAMNLELDARIGGQSNGSPLTALGEAQAAALGARLAAEGVAAPPCFVSTAVRAVDTARIAMEALGLEAASALVADAALLEQDAGEWEGALRSECYTAAVLAEIAADTRAFAAPGGESQAEVEERAFAFLKAAVLPAARIGGPPALVFGHGMAIKCLLRRVLDSDARMTRKIALANASITELGFVPGGAGAAGAGGTAAAQPGWHVLRVNDCAHLAGLA
jgi:broad specificity phosphatase PhoE